MPMENITKRPAVKLTSRKIRGGMKGRFAVAV
jgi:hypothetical protein